MVPVMFTLVVRRSRNITAILATAVGLTLLNACGGTGSEPSPADNGSSSVASIKTTATATATATKTPAPQAERPLLRDDASEAEQNRLRVVYSDCLVQHGLPKEMIKGPGGYPGDFESLGLRKGLAAKLKAACGSKEPELPIQRAARLDPDFADHIRADVKCLNSHGIKAIVQDGKDVGLVNGLPSSSKSHWLDDCERKAFAGYYSTLS
jgi:hypothetical protein